MASGVATALDAEHVDDAGTPPRPVKMQVLSQLVLLSQTYCFSDSWLSWLCCSGSVCVMLAESNETYPDWNMSPSIPQALSNVCPHLVSCRDVWLTSDCYIQHEEGQEAVKAEAQGQQQQGAPASGKTRPGKSVPGGPAIKSEPMADTDGEGRGLDGHASAPHAEDGEQPNMCHRCAFLPFAYCMHNLGHHAQTSGVRICSPHSMLQCSSKSSIFQCQGQSNPLQRKADF